MGWETFQNCLDVNCQRMVIKELKKKKKSQKRSVHVQLRLATVEYTVFPSGALIHTACTFQYAELQLRRHSKRIIYIKMIPDLGRASESRKNQNLGGILRHNTFSILASSVYVWGFSNNNISQYWRFFAWASVWAFVFNLWKRRRPVIFGSLLSSIGTGLSDPCYAGILGYRDRAWTIRCDYCPLKIW
jgi:hypothetical protein